MILVTGGASSGKSAFAERYAAYLGHKGIYIATSQIIDDEMERRIELHRTKRLESGFAWETYEEPYDLTERINQINSDYTKVDQAHDMEADMSPPVVLVDCMTMWLTNWLLSYERQETEYEPQDKVQQQIVSKMDDLLEAVTAFQGKIILVTNEVGDSITPQQRLGRRFRDLAGLMNQHLAAKSEQVFLVTAGIPIELKQREFILGR